MPDSSPLVRLVLALKQIASPFFPLSLPKLPPVLIILLIDSMHGKAYDSGHLVYWPYQGDVEYLSHNPLGVQANIVVEDVSLFE